MNTISLTYDPQASRLPVSLPLSKSVALRALTLNAVAAATGAPLSKILRLPDADDVTGMQRAMDLYFSQLVRIAMTKAGGDDSCPANSDPLIESYERVDIGQGGAPLRFFTALAASTPGVRIDLDCEASLKERPHALLIELLREAGADIKGQGEKGNRPPYRITGRRLAPGALAIDADVSSQYISALMMAAPLWKDGLDLTLTGDRIVSMPYINMTASLMREFGIEVKVDGKHIRIPAAGSPIKSPESLTIPTDWSAASYFYEFVAIAGGAVEIESLTPPDESLQGDAMIDKMVWVMDVATRFEADGKAEIVQNEKFPYPTYWGCDFADTPDLVPAVVVAACLSGIMFEFSGISHLRHKETDRLAALVTELRKLGYVLQVYEEEDKLLWHGERCEPEKEPVIATYNDHRMAMAFAPAAIRFPGLRIERPEVVAKSFPGYWEQLSRLGLQM